MIPSPKLGSELGETLPPAQRLSTVRELCCEATQRNLHFKTLQEVAVVAPGKSVITHHKQLQVSHAGISSLVMGGDAPVSLTSFASC